MDIQYGPAQSDQDLQGILNIQTINLPGKISSTEAQEQGFVTVKHDLPLLRDMNARHQHAIAKVDNEVVGYTLVMQRHFGDRIPVLLPLFKLIDSLLWQGQSLAHYRYFIMGQVAIKKDYRGQGIFAGLYQELGERLSPHFDLVVTEIATRNTRSIRAHEKVGFETLHIYTSPDGEEWAVVGKGLF